MNICVVGCGAIATNCHGPSYVKYKLSHNNFTMAACCDTDAAKAEAFKTRFGFGRAYTDMHAMLKAERPDALCVLVGENHTARVALELLEYGIPMLIEKPPGKDAAETRQLMEAAARLGTPHMVAYNRRFLPLNVLCRQWLDEDGAPPHYIHYEMFRCNRDDEDFSDTAVHAIDAVRFLAGAEYAHISFVRQKTCGVHAQNVYIQARMDTGCEAHIHICPMSGALTERAVIHRGQSTFRLQMPIWGSGCDGAGALTEYRNGAAARAVTGDELADSAEVFETNGFYAENRFFFDAVAGGAALHPTFEEALATSVVKELYADESVISAHIYKDGDGHMRVQP